MTEDSGIAMNVALPDTADISWEDVPLTPEEEQELQAYTAEMDTLMSEQEAFMENMAGILQLGDLEEDASAKLTELGFPGMNEMSSEQRSEIDMYYFEHNNMVNPQCWKWWCTVPLNISLRVTLKIAAIATGIIVKKVAALLALKSLGTSIIASVFILIGLKIVVKIGNKLIGMLVDHVCCL
ncbi:MAG: hypothetical protein SGARI_005434 [Bacillariaceae sp.]